MYVEVDNFSTNENNKVSGYKVEVSDLSVAVGFTYELVETTITELEQLNLKC